MTLLVERSESSKYHKSSQMNLLTLFDIFYSIRKIFLVICTLFQDIFYTFQTYLGLSTWGWVWIYPESSCKYYEKNKIQNLMCFFSEKYIV